MNGQMLQLIELLKEVVYNITVGYIYVALLPLMSGKPGPWILISLANPFVQVNRCVGNPRVLGLN